MVFPLIPEPNWLRVIWDTSASNQFEVRVKKKRFTEEQIAYALAQESTGQTIAEICRKLGVSEQTFYRWKKKFGSMGVAEVRRLKQLEDENAKLKRLVADLSLDKAILQDVLRKKV